MNNKKEPSINENNAKKPKNRKNNRILLIFVCIFVSIVIFVGGILGIFALIRKNNSVASYGSYLLSVGEANYFASCHKYNLLVSLGADAYDTEHFWASEYEDGRTYGDLLKESFREYISGILVANALFDKYSSLEKSDKEYLKQLTDNALKNRGGEEKFNKEAEKFGFDFDDYCSAAELLYKAAMAQNALFGENGEKLSSFPEECEDYYEENYSRVSLLFLRDEEVIDKDENGNEILRPMTDSEKAERAEYAEKLRTAITNSQNGTGDTLISTDMYEYYYRRSDSDMDMYRNYYFNISSAATEEFSEAFPELVEKALSMNIGEYAEAECSVGTCFIYKEELSQHAYTDSDNPFFSDFYSEAVFPIYSGMLKLYAEDVTFSDKFENVDIISLPKNYTFAIGITPS